MSPTRSASVCELPTGRVCGSVTEADGSASVFRLEMYKNATPPPAHPPPPHKNAHLLYVHFSWMLHVASVKADYTQTLSSLSLAGHLGLRQATRFC